MTTTRNRTEPAVNRRLGFEAAPKVVCSHCNFIPQCWTGSRWGVYVCVCVCVKWKPMFFLIITPEFQHLYYTLAVIAENVPISGIPILIFLCLFITSSSPVSQFYLCPGEKKRSNLAKMSRVGVSLLLDYPPLHQSWRDLVSCRLFM